MPGMRIWRVVVHVGLFTLCIMLSCIAISRRIRSICALRESSPLTLYLGTGFILFSGPKRVY
jgi:hypothetical protein